MLIEVLNNQGGLVDVYIADNEAEAQHYVQLCVLMFGGQKMFLRAVYV